MKLAAFMFNTSTDTSTADISGQDWFNKSGSHNGDDPYAIEENGEICANQVFDRDPISLANSKHKENLSSDNWFSDEGDNAKSERLPELSTMVGSLKNGESFEGNFGGKSDKKADNNNSDSDDDGGNEDLIIGPMPPKRKVESDDEDDDILGSNNVGTVGKLEVNKTGVATKLKIKPINISLKSKNFDSDKSNDDNEEEDAEKVKPIGSTNGVDEKSDEDTKKDDTSTNSDENNTNSDKPPEVPEVEEEDEIKGERVLLISFTTLKVKRLSKKTQQ